MNENRTPTLQDSALPLLKTLWTEHLTGGPVKTKNTQINYLYRDAGNYKICNSCIIKGEIEAEQEKEIRQCCLPEYIQFIPSRVGLPEHRFDGWSEDDTPFFELEGFELTEEDPDVDLTVRQLVTRFEVMKDSWSSPPPHILSRR